MSLKPFIKSLPSSGGTGAVDSVFGRTGVVVADPGDYELYYLDNAENIIIYKTLLDFQQNTVVVDGKYQLTAGKRYLYGGTGSITLDLPIDLNGSLLDLGSPLFGLAILYLGTDPLFNGASGSVKNGIVACPNSPCFNILKTGAGGEYCFVDNFLLADATSYGTIDVNDLRINYCGSIDIDNGFDFNGVDWNTFVIREFNLQSSSPAFIGLDFRGSLLSDAKINQCVIQAPSGATGVMLDPNSANTVANERFNYTEGKFAGGLTPIAGGGTIDDIRNYFFNNGGLRDSYTAVDTKLNTPVEVAIAVPDVFVKVADLSWIGKDAAKLSFDSDGNVKNETESPIEILVHGSIVLEKVAGGSDLLRAMICYNDDPLNTSSQWTIKSIQNSQESSLSLRGIFNLNPQDYISIYVANGDTGAGNKNIDVTEADVSIFKVL
ncbi:hypothetical protein CL622_04515 [archaeon]|nr:hypothetical protein [archaeon]|tara:strand:- start:2867 stop:4171 length:1305 start_codon:yes stop_codon:yes gene_type:complete